MTDIAALFKEFQKEQQAFQKRIESRLDKLEAADANPRLRKTSAQEKHASVRAPVRQQSWGPRLRLDTSKLPPRPGYVQRWVRTKLDGEWDGANLDRAFNDGWRPRKRENIPEGMYLTNTENLASYGFEGQAISIHGMVLMERPVEVHEVEAQAERDMNEAQMRSVRSTVSKTYNRAHRGFTPIQMDHQSQIERGGQIVES